MSFTLTCNCCGHKQELVNKTGEQQIKYYADLQAAEELHNESICVIENKEIRKMRLDDDKTKVIFVYVSNPLKTSGYDSYIKKGEYVRYRIIN